MNQLAAERFVNYWEARRALLGPDYHLRMTLSEAFCDDVDALEKGVFSILPHPDLNGRPLVYVEAHRNTGVGYTAESLVSETLRCYSSWCMHKLISNVARLS